MQIFIHKKQINKYLCMCLIYFLVLISKELPFIRGVNRKLAKNLYDVKNLQYNVIFQASKCPIKFSRSIGMLNTLKFSVILH